VKLVLDTNVVLAGIVADGLCRNLIQKYTHSHSLFTSSVLMRELDEKLKTKFAERLNDLPLILPFLKRMTLVEPQPLTANVCRDADDDVVLATALAAKADGPLAEQLITPLVTL